MVNRKKGFRASHVLILAMMTAVPPLVWTTDAVAKRGMVDQHKFFHNPKFGSLWNMTRRERLAYRHCAALSSDCGK